MKNFAGRAVSLGTALVCVLTQGVFPYASENAFWSARRKATRERKAGAVLASLPPLAEGTVLPVFPGDVRGGQRFVSPLSPDHPRVDAGRLHRALAPVLDHVSPVGLWVPVAMTFVGLEEFPPTSFLRSSVVFLLESFRVERLDWASLENASRWARWLSSMA